MPPKNVTMKSIADILGVSTTTIHRSLNGKPGVGDDMDKKIKALAAKMGYHSNYFAASLKGKGFRVAIALPEPVDDNRYYYLNLWMGARKFLSTVTELVINASEFYYPYDEVSNSRVLKEIYELHSDNIDALLTLVSDNSQSSYFLEKFKEKGIAVALVGADLYRDFRFCCVKTYDEMVGRLGAEILTSFCREGGHKIILTGSPSGPLGMIDQFLNINGFTEYIKNLPFDFPIITAFENSNPDVYGMIKDIVAKNPDVYAMYSCSSRHTVQMCRAVEDLGLAGRIKLVGNDYFPESIVYLKRGTLTAIIDKKISEQSFLAMQALFDYTVKKEYPTSSLIYVKPSVVMKSNADIESVDSYS